MPLLNRIRNNLIGMGLDPERLYTAMGRFQKLGDRSGAAKRLPLYQILKWHLGMVVNPEHPYHQLANRMVWLSDRYPRPLLRPIPSWFKELTHEPAA